MYLSLVVVLFSSLFHQKRNTPVPESCQYRRVYFGAIIDDTTSRWLTHKETASDVIHAIETVQMKLLEPWDKRP